MKEICVCCGQCIEPFALRMQNKSGSREGSVQFITMTWFIISMQCSKACCSVVQDKYIFLLGKSLFTRIRLTARPQATHQPTESK